MKTISIFLALVNALLAGLMLASSLPLTELRSAELWWSFTKIAAATAVILVGVITWLGSARPVRAGLIPLCSLFLVALGAATVVWTFHLALVTGDMEFHMIIYGGSLAVQGMASLFGLAGDPRSMAV
jgi:4-amino-4-deoxy-L-arabinose transferase-like glycosyltransferase